jgi:hypothetical protein
MEREGEQEGDDDIGSKQLKSTNTHTHTISHTLTHFHTHSHTLDTHTHFTHTHSPNAVVVDLEYVDEACWGTAGANDELPFDLRNNKMIMSDAKNDPLSVGENRVEWLN